MKCKTCKNDIPDGSIFCNWCGAKQIREKKQKGDIKIPEPRKLPSGNWFVQLRIDGQSVSITETSRDRAAAKAMAIKAGMIEEKKKPRDLTLGEAIDSYIKDRDSILSPSTIKAYKSCRAHRFQDLMDRKISTITPQLLQKAINEELKADKAPSGVTKRGRAEGKVSAKTVSNSFALIRTVLSKETDIDFHDIVLPAKTAAGGKTLDPQDIGALMRAVQGDDIEIPVLLAVWLGLRRSEIAALRKEDFDFTKKTVSVTAALVLNDQNEWVTKGTKTTNSTRLISCPDYILDKVKALPDGRILTMYPNTLYTKLHRVCEANGIPAVRFHDLRHCAASVMLLLGVPDKYAMERGGWASKQTMTGRYQHTVDSARQAVDQKIDGYYYALLTPNANENANE